MFVHTATITRLDTSSPFFYDTPEGSNPLLYETLTNALIAQGFLISVARINSPDNLVLTRVVTCPTENDFNECLHQVMTNFPSTYINRNNYNHSYNHVMVQTKQTI